MVPRKGKTIIKFQLWLHCSGSAGGRSGRPLPTPLVALPLVLPLPLAPPASTTDRPSQEQSSPSLPSLAVATAWPSRRPRLYSQ